MTGISFLTGSESKPWRNVFVFWQTWEEKPRFRGLLMFCKASCPHHYYIDFNLKKRKRTRKKLSAQKQLDGLLSETRLEVVGAPLSTFHLMYLGSDALGCRWITELLKNCLGLEPAWYRFPGSHNLTGICKQFCLVSPTLKQMCHVSVKLKVV